MHSSLSNGAKEILYLSAPSLISTPIPVQPLGPINQLIYKSTDRGNTWTEAKGMPTLQPLLSGGSCAALLGYADQELIIWGDGFVTPNGTVIFGLRRCTGLSVAISDDEGDSWRLVDIPGSSLPPFLVGDLTYVACIPCCFPSSHIIDTCSTGTFLLPSPSHKISTATSTPSGSTTTTS